MKKILICVVLSFIILICGCTTGSKQDIEELKKQIEELKKENQILKEKSGSNSQETMTNSELIINDQNNANYIKVGQTIEEKEFCQFTIKKVEFTKTVKPPRPDSFYSYYQVKEKDSIYLHVVTQIKNLQTSGIAADEFLDITAKYNNKYDYTGFSTIEEPGGGDFTYTSITNIDPLKKGNVHFLLEVPLQVKDEKTPLALNISVNGNKYVCIIR